jgi:hypothetical protein
MSQVAFTPGTLALVETEARFHLRINVTSLNGSTEFGVSQRVEDVRTFAGQTVTVSFYAKSDSTRINTLFLNQNFGSGGSASVNKTSNFTTTTSWQRFSITFLLDSVSGKTIGDGSFLDVKFAPALAVSTFDLWGVQLESGPTATPFRRNAPSIQAEIAACQRYYVRYSYPNNAYMGVAVGHSTNQFAIQWSFPTEMRVTPTFEAISGGIFLYPNAGTFYNFSGGGAFVLDNKNALLTGSGPNITYPDNRASLAYALGTRTFAFNAEL